MTFESWRRRGVLPVISSRGSEWWSWCRGRWQPNRFSLWPCVLSLLHPSRYYKDDEWAAKQSPCRGLYAVQSRIWLETMRCYTKIKGVPLFEGTEVKWNSICNLKLHKPREGQLWPGNLSSQTQFYSDEPFTRIKFLLAVNPFQSYICLWTRSGKLTNYKEHSHNWSLLRWCSEWNCIFQRQTEMHVQPVAAPRTDLRIQWERLKHTCYQRRHWTLIYILSAWVIKQNIINVLIHQ